MLTSEPSPYIHQLNDTHLQLAWIEDKRAIHGKSVDMKNPLQSTDNIDINLTTNYFKLSLSGTYPETLIAAQSSFTYLFYKPFQSSQNNINIRTTNPLDSTVSDTKTTITWTHSISSNNRTISIQTLNSTNHPISQVVTANTYLSGIVSNPSIAHSGDTNAIAWQGYSDEQDAKENIYLRIFNQNYNFSTPTEIPVNNFTKGVRRTPKITSRHNLFALTWTDSGNTLSAEQWAQGRVYFINGTSATQVFNLNNIHSVSKPNVYPSTNNRFTYVWAKRYGKDTKLFSRTIDVSEYVVEQNIKADTKTPTTTASVSHTLHATPSITSGTETPPSITKTVKENNKNNRNITNSTTTTPSHTHSFVHTARHTNTTSHTNSEAVITVSESFTPIIDNNINNPTSITKEKVNKTTKPTSIPVQAQTASHATASAVSATSVSPVTAGIAIRANTITATMSCEEHFYHNNTFALSDNLSPSLNFLIGEAEDKSAYSNLLYSSALLIGSFALIGTITYFAPPALVGIKIIAAIATHFPGNFLPLSMFLSATAITSSITILKIQQNRGSLKAIMAQGGATLNLVSSVVQLGYYTQKATTIKEHAVFKDNKWIAFEGEEKYVKKHRVAFQDYREGKEWFVAIDIGMNIATSAMPGWKPDALSDCASTKHVATALYTAYTITQITAQPHAETYHKIANSAANILICTTAVLNSAQEIQPDLKNSSTINDIINTAPMFATAIATGIGIYDIGKMGKKLYDKPFSSTDSIQNAQLAPPQGALTVPQKQQTPHTVTTNDNDHTAVQINPLTQKLLSGHNNDQQDYI